jgi:hypothetical protein
MVRKALALGATCTVITGLISCGATDIIVEIDNEADTLSITDISDVDFRFGTAVVIEEIHMDVGDTVVITVTALDALGLTVAGVDPTWASTNPGVATIVAGPTVVPGAPENSAIVAAIAEGTTTFSATVESVTAVLPATVGDTTTVPPPAGLASITVTPPSAFLSAVGDTVRFQAEARDSTGTVIAAPITWQSTNPSVALVSGGRTTAQGFGTAYIKASSACCTPDSARLDVAAASQALDFFSDWRTGTGDTQNVLFDGAKFNRRLCGGIVDGNGFAFDDLLDVVADPTGVFPPGIQNVLQITYHQTGSAACNMLAADLAWPTPAVGEYLFSRVYMYADIDVGQEAVGHWFHHGSNALGNDYPFFWTGQTVSVAPDSTYSLWAGVGPAGGVGGAGHGSFSLTVKTHRLYRFELRIHRTDPDSIRFQARIYDGAGSLVATGANFVCESGPCGFQVDTLGQYKASYTGPRGLNSLEVGNNGPAQQPSGFEQRYVSGVAIRVSPNPDAWIGPYPVPGAEN